jgi:hypothetical protein
MYANNMQISNIKKGSVVKIWHHPRGHDYVVVGENSTKKELYLVKLNCLNEDGTVHKSTKRFHKTLSYTQIGGRRVVSNVNKVLGEKDLKDYSLDSLLIEYEGSVQVLPVNKNFVCSPKSDNNNIVNYNY